MTDINKHIEVIERMMFAMANYKVDGIRIQPTLYAAKEAFETLEHQKAEIERLQTELVATRYSENAFKEENRRLVKLKKVDVIKEFAERLKEQFAHSGKSTKYGDFTWGDITSYEIDNLVKEMTENEGKV